MHAASDAGTYLKKYWDGVVYAVQFTEGEIEKMKDGWGSGISYFGTIPPDRIVAKAEITGLKSGAELPYVPDRFGKNFWAINRPDSLLGRLHEKVVRDYKAYKVGRCSIARDFCTEACSDALAATLSRRASFPDAGRASGASAKNKPRNTCSSWEAT